jgi:hypothetical protein
MQLCYKPPPQFPQLAMGLDLENPTGKITELLKSWKKAGSLAVIERQNKNRETRKYIEATRSTLQPWVKTWVLHGRPFSLEISEVKNG